MALWPYFVREKSQAAHHFYPLASRIRRREFIYSIRMFDELLVLENIKIVTSDVVFFARMLSCRH